MENGKYVTRALKRFKPESTGYSLGIIRSFSLQQKASRTDIFVSSSLIL